MRSYSIAVLVQPDFTDANLLEQLGALRQQLPFASFFLYGTPENEGQKIAIQKLDMTLRQDDSANRFRVSRRMFTEVDADIFVYVGHVAYPPAALSSMIHQLVEGRVDMVAATNEASILASAPSRDLCEKLYGRNLEAPLSDYRVFSRRFVKSFSAFERGFPIELEWSIHALELDIPYMEFPVETPLPFTYPYPRNSRLRLAFTRLVQNLQARPLKWFGLLTGWFLLLTAIYKLIFCLEYLGYKVPINENISALAAASFAMMAFIAAMSGLLLHSHSHVRRELKRLHFQQHSTL